MSHSPMPVEDERPRSWGTPTAGPGTRTTAHLNLTRSLADVGWPEAAIPNPTTREPIVWPREDRRDTRIPYAGSER